MLPLHPHQLEIPKQITKSLHKQVTYVQQQNQLRIQTVGKPQGYDNMKNNYHEIGGIFSDQISQQHFENQYMTRVLKRYYRQVTHND